MHTYFSFLKSFIWSKSKGLDFSVNIFWQSSNWAYSKNKLYKTSDSSVFEKGPGLFYPPYLSTNFQKICVSHAIFNQLTKFHCLIAFTFWDIWQYLYCDCLSYSCGVTNFEVCFRFLINPFSAWPEIQNKNWNTLRTKIAFKVK